ncbi:MAG: 4'-phosphopantetheinyl transferase superfamily protein [Solirubrobacteraceae bacterium]
MPGIGIDLLEIDRLERRPRLAERLFTDAEREYAAARARPGQHLAARAVSVSLTHTRTTAGAVAIAE